MTRLLRAVSHLDRSPEVARCLAGCRPAWGVVRRYLAGGGGGYPLAVSLPGGVRLELQNYHDLATAWVVFFRDEYRLPGRAKAILDLGANIGCFSLRAAARFPAARVVAVEPFPSTFERLSANVAANRPDGRIVCWRLGVAAGAGERVMSAEGPSQSRGIQPDGGATAAPGDARVPVAPLGEVVARAAEEMRAEVIDFLKIDIEGGEHESILATPTTALARVARLGMEYHPNRPKAPLFAHLEGAGLRLVHDRPFGAEVGVAHFARA